MGLPRVARVYVAAVIAAGVACLAIAATELRATNMLLFVTLLAAGVVTSAAKIELPLGRSQSNLSLSHAVNFWALFALSPADAISIAAVSAWSQCTMHAAGRNPVHRIIFSIASLVVTVAVSAPVLFWFRDATHMPVAALVRGAALVAPVYFFVNTVLVAGAISLSTKQRITAIWQQNFLWSAPSYFAGAALALLADAAWTRGWFGWLALLVVPLYLVFRSYDTVVTRLRKEQEDTRRAMEVQLATIEALALAIDAKAGCTPEHVRSIQYYAATLAEAVGMSDVDVQAVRTAALLHDVGNMAVPEHILSKPSSLTAEEFERVKIHPRVGAEILRNVPFAGPVNDLVLCHHERWDGLGYPSGLSGDNIPLGARILAVADCFSTLQSDRPYRPKRSQREALAVVREHAGTAYDPLLVELLVSRVEGVAAPLGDALHASDGESGLQDIAGAHREAHTLYEIAQSLGSSLGVAEAMALIQEKVNRLVPFVTCALFLGDDEHGYACRYAHGPGTEALFKSAPKTWAELAKQIPVCADGRAGHGEDLASVLACPLRFNGRLIGGLVVYHMVDGCFTDEHRRVLGRVSDQAAAVVYNSTRFEQTQHESHTDPLTGLPNRRSLDRQVEAGLAHATRAKSVFSVVVLDLDRLKEINDTYGHEAGDRAIRTVGTVLRSTIRQADICARFAGDEFVVILWDYLPEHESRVRDLQHAISAHAFEPRPGVHMALSISAGPARFPEDGRTFEELLAVADERMYHDKAGRRSRSAGRRPLPQLEPV